MRRFFLLALFLLASTALAAGLAACSSAPAPTPPPQPSPVASTATGEGASPTPLPTLTPTPTETPTPTATPNPYESLVNIEPSSLTIESFLSAMPADIRATHENPSAATQEQKDAHDKWISDAWKAVFSSLSDEQLNNIGLNRVDIATLGLGSTGATYTEVDGKQYPVYDYSLLRAIEAFSQEFNVYQAPFMINLGEQIKVDPANWISAHRDTVINPGETLGRWYGYGSDGGYFSHEVMMKGLFDDRNYFGKMIPMKRATLEWAFSGDLRLVFDYPGYPNSHIGLISMNDTDSQKTKRYTLVLFNIGQGTPMTIKINPTPNSVDKDRLAAANFEGPIGSFEIKSVHELLQIIEASYNELGFPPHISKMGGGEGATLISDESSIPYTQNILVLPFCRRTSPGTNFSSLSHADSIKKLTAQAKTLKVSFAHRTHISSEILMSICLLVCQKRPLGGC